MIWQLLGPLCWGGTVVFVARPSDPAGILRCVDEHHIGTIELVPTLLRAVLDEVDRGRWSARSLTTLISSGEALTDALLDHASRALPGCPVFNQYGPTETASQVTYHRCPPGAVVTVGRPIAGTRIDVLDPDGARLPAGDVGEIVVGGAGVARGT